MSFPLPLVDWSTVGPDLSPGQESAEWPPRSVKPRISRLHLYYNLFEGDFSQVTDDLRLQMNYFKMVPERVAEELLSIAPTTGEAEADEEVQDVLYDSLIDMCRYGGAVLWTDPEGSVQLLDPRFYVPTETGWIYALPIANVPDGVYDTAHIIGQSGDTLYSEVRSYASGYLGGVIEELFSELFEDTLVVAPLNPMRGYGHWGTSMYDAMGPAVIEIARRYTANSAYLDKQRNPNMAVRGNKGDVLGLAPEIDPGELTYEQEQDLINQRLSQTGTDLEDNDVVFLPPEIQSAEPITWDGRIVDSMEQIREMRNMLQAITTVPGLGLNPGEFQVATSGVALRIINRPFFSKSGSMQKRLIRAYRESSGIQLDWPHPYSEEEGDIVEVEDVPQG